MSRLAELLAEKALAHRWFEPTIISKKRLCSMTETEPENAGEVQFASCDIGCLGRYDRSYCTIEI
jgi:hypothetical protein